MHVATTIFFFSLTDDYRFFYSLSFLCFPSSSLSGLRHGGGPKKTEGFQDKPAFGIAAAKAKHDVLNISFVSADATLLLL